MKGAPMLSFDRSFFFASDFDPLSPHHHCASVFTYVCLASPLSSTEY